MIEMPPGTGKSVVIALLIGLLNGRFRKITILYNDADLLAFEHDTIESIKKFACNMEIEVTSL